VRRDHLWGDAAVAPRLRRCRPGRARRGRARPVPVEAGERGHPDEGPSSSRMLSFTWVAMNSKTSSAMSSLSDSALVRRIAGVSRGPGVDLGDQAREETARSRSSSVSIERGARSEVRTICFPAPWRSL